VAIHAIHVANRRHPNSVYLSIRDGHHERRSRVSSFVAYRLPDGTGRWTSGLVAVARLFALILMVLGTLGQLHIVNLSNPLSRDISITKLRFRALRPPSWTGSRYPTDRDTCWGGGGCCTISGGVVLQGAIDGYLSGSQLLTLVR
jgi:hypothetical protein